jgi:dipicolinate synthase subunit B
MPDFKNITIGFAVTGSFCTFDDAFAQARNLISLGAKLIPIMSENAYGTSTRFGEAKARARELEEICGREIIKTIADAEPLGPGRLTDALLVCPCTGNTMAKLANSITDTAVVK